MLAALLLAAGRSTRFGSSKLAAELDGDPVCVRTAATLAQLPHDLRLAVVSEVTPDLSGLGFDPVPIDRADAPLSYSIAIGIRAAEARRANTVLIALADMPLVPLAHYRALIDRFDGAKTCTRIAGVAMPPAIFGSDLFKELARLDGDRGARHLLGSAPAIELSAELGLDIDTQADLERARSILLKAAKVHRHQPLTRT